MNRYESGADHRRRQRRAGIPQFRGGERLIASIRKVRISAQGLGIVLDSCTAFCHFNPHNETLEVILSPNQTEMMGIPLARPSPRRIGER